MLTEAATRFVGADTFSALTGEPAYTSLWERPGEVLHVRLAREADVAVVVPATANVLAKLAHGLADDLLTATLLEATCPLVIAPAMHSGMWEHPATRANVASAAAIRGADDRRTRDRAARPRRRRDRQARGAGGRRRCGPRSARAAGSRRAPVVDHLRPDPRADRPRPLHREPIHREDGGRARGRGGRRGAPPSPSSSAREPWCRRASRSCRSRPRRRCAMPCSRGSTDADAVVMAAAVADFRPKADRRSEAEEGGGRPRAAARADARHPGGAGGAADGPGPRRASRRRPRTWSAPAGRSSASKHLDLVVVNRVGREGTGFGADANEAMLLGASDGARAAPHLDEARARRRPCSIGSSRSSPRRRRPSVPTARLARA